MAWNGKRNKTVQNCEQCEEMKPKNQKETLRPHSDGSGHWDKVGTDLYEIKGRNYLLVIEYYSNLIQVDQLSSTTSKQVIDKLKKNREVRFTATNNK